jgi:hypothetical protein
MIDIGEQEVDQIAVAPLVIRNRGRGELVIDRITSSCSCSGLEREDGATFAPVQELRLGGRAEASLRVRFSVRGIPGEPARSAITIRTNDPAAPEWRMEIFVPQVIGGVVTTPRSLVFGTLLAGKGAQQVLEVRDTNPTPRMVERVSSSHPDRVAVRWLPAEADAAAPTLRGAGKVLGQVEVSVLPGEPGSIDERVEIRLAGHQPVQVPVLGRIVPIVEVTPSLLILPRESAGGAAYDGTCTCRSNQLLPLSIADVSSDKELSVQIEPVEGNPHLKLVRVKWHPSVGAKLTPTTRRVVHAHARVGDQAIPVEFSVDCIGREAP